MKFHFLTQERMKMGYTRKRHEALVVIADRSRKSFFQKFFVEREIGAVAAVLTITAIILAVSALQFGTRFWLYIISLCLILSTGFLFENIYYDIWEAEKMVNAKSLRKLLSGIAGKGASEILVPEHLEHDGYVKKSDLHILETVWDIINVARRNVEPRILDDVLYLRLESFFNEELEGYMLRRRRKAEEKIEELKKENSEKLKEIEDLRKNLGI